MADLTSLPSKVCRAIRYYLVSSGAADPSRCYHYFDSRERKFNDQPIVDVLMRPVGPEEQYSGNEVFIIEIQVKFNSVQQPNEPNEAPRVAFDKLVGQVRMQMIQTDDGQELNATRKLINQAAYRAPIAPDDGGPGDLFAKNNADLADFTLLSLYQDIYGMAKSEQVNWALVMRFKVSACESKVDGYA